MKLPVIIVNFKAYQQSTGQNAVALAKIHDRVAKETGASIVIAVNAIDLVHVIKAVDIPVFAQHVDPVSYGNFTGHIPADLALESGAYGTLLNHAEYPVGLEVLQKTIAQARTLDLFSVVCANTPEVARDLALFNPDLIAVEPPELIGGDVSVAKAGPHIIEEAVKLVGQGRLLVGAGIKDAEDIRIALSLGASGVLLASGVVKAEDPYVALMNLVSALK